MYLIIYSEFRYKNLTFLSVAKKEEVVDYVTELAESYSTEAQVTDDIKPSPSALMSSDDLFSCLLGEVDLTSSSASTVSEVQQYMAEPVRVADPLDWWKLCAGRWVMFNHKLVKMLFLNCM